MKTHSNVTHCLKNMTSNVMASAVLAVSLCVPSVFAQNLQQVEQARQAGQMQVAQSTLETMVAAGGESKQYVRALGLLAAMVMEELDYDRAEQLLGDARQISQTNAWDDVEAELANYQGLLHQKLGQSVAALAAYQESKAKAARTGAMEVEHQAMLNIALLHDQNNDIEQAGDELSALADSLANNSSANAAHWLGAGKLALRLGKNEALGLLQKGQKLADEQRDVFAQSLSYGYLGHLYELTGKMSDALTLTDVAIKYALQGDYGNLMVQWEWQRGRIFELQGDNHRGLSALRRAVVHVEANRQDIPVEYSGGRSSFRETLGPLYADLARSLLDSAARQSGAQQQALYREARQSVELIKRTELEDYFNNRCALEAVDDVVLDDIGANTASLYPLIFDDRLDLLLSIDGNISHFSVDVNRATLSAYAKTLASNLRDRADFKVQSQKLYEWLVKPVEPALKQAGVDTLVFLPDSVLRLVPLAMLNSGSHYVMNNYAVVTSPGLSVFDPRKTEKHAVSALLAGMSQPGDVVRDLPNDVLASLLPSDDAYASLKQRSLNGDQNVARDLSGQALVDVQRNLAIPGVEREVSRLSSVLPAKTLLNDQFTKASLEESMLSEPYNVVHIASHGVFGSTAENSFIMAHDQIISMNELQSILYSEKFKDAPIELITLSACQTAEGDDRAPLGISGVALQAKVRSALGSLWSISDEATVRFMELFYTNLMSGKMTKSEALRQAQMSLAKDDKFAHPYYWSPFVLIGNWL